jgi:cytochrome P450
MAIIELADYGAEFMSNPYPYYAKLREAGPVHEVRLPTGRRFWLIVGYDEVRTALTDSRLSKQPPPAEAANRLIGQHVLTADPPDHTRLRKLISREFTPRRVADLGPRIQQVTDDLLREMLPAGHGDIVGQLAFRLSITVICELLGVPLADREAFRQWTDDILAPPEEAVMASASLGLRAYLNDLIEAKRSAPAAGDLLSALLRTRAEQADRLSAAELLATAFVLLMAGHETTLNLIGNAVRALLTHADQLALLRADPTLIDAAIEETLRFDGPVESSSRRFATEPLVYGHTVIPPGDTVLVSLAAADRDPARFAEPGAFDIRRTRAAGGAGHLAFGHGIHFCLGAPLARLEGRIALSTLLARCPRLELNGTVESLDWLPGVLIRGTRHLPVRW